MYLDRGGLRCGNSQQHVGHLVDDQLCYQLFIFLHMLTNQRHGAVHHLQRQKNGQSGSCMATEIELNQSSTRWQWYISYKCSDPK